MSGISRTAIEVAARAVRENLPPGTLFGPYLNALDCVEFTDIALTAAYPVIRAEVIAEVVEALRCFERRETGHHFMDPSGFIAIKFDNA